MKMSMLSQSILVALSSVPNSLSGFYRQNTISDEYYLVRGNKMFDINKLKEIINRDKNVPIIPVGKGLAKEIIDEIENLREQIDDIKKQTHVIRSIIQEPLKFHQDSDPMYVSGYTDAMRLFEEFNIGDVSYELEIRLLNAKVNILEEFSGDLANHGLGTHLSHELLDEQIEWLKKRIKRLSRLKLERDNYHDKP